MLKIIYWIGCIAILALQVWNVRRAYALATQEVGDSLGIGDRLELRQTINKKSVKALRRLTIGIILTIAVIVMAQFKLINPVAVIISGVIIEVLGNIVIGEVLDLHLDLMRNLHEEMERM